jgi:hypothetical protein
VDIQSITSLLISMVVAWAVYRRLRRTIGRQLVQTGRLRYRIGVFTVLGALILYASLSEFTLLAALIGGIGCGALLAPVGLRHTKFETTAEGRFYTPHTYIGLIVSALFLARIAFRLASQYLAPHAEAVLDPNPFAAYKKNPLTLSIFGVLIGYYIVFNFGVLRRSRAAAVPVLG